MCFKSLRTQSYHSLLTKFFSVSGKGLNYIGMLEDLSKEQKFDVTFVDIDDKTEDGETQCLVQISTLPVAVCYGVGKDLDKAKSDAARFVLWHSLKDCKSLMILKLFHFFCLPHLLFTEGNHIGQNNINSPCITA